MDKVVYQIQFVGDCRWGGKPYVYYNNNRTFGNYVDACRCLDDIGTEVFGILKEKTPGNIEVECHEVRDEQTDSLSSIEFFTACASLDYVRADVVPICLETEYKRKKTYKVELWYNIYRVVKVEATDEDTALDMARETPLSQVNITNAQEVDCCVEEVK